MKSLKEALISKSNRDWASTSKYLNNKHVFLYIPSIVYGEIETLLGKYHKSPKCKILYWVIDFNELKDFVKKYTYNIKADYIYAIEKEEYDKYVFDDFTEEVDNWDEEEEKFNGWPRIDGKELEKLR